MFEKIRKLFDKKKKQERKRGTGSLEEVHRKNIDPTSAAWNGAGTSRRGMKGPGNVPF